MIDRRTKKNPKNEKLMEKITRILQERSSKSYEIAKKLILSKKMECKKLNEAFEYYAKSWIDYTHVGLISIACEAVGGDPDKAVTAQVAMLLLAASVDVHDDIIDESKTKYGRPTLFGKFGKDVSLLIGDAFLIKALTYLRKLEKHLTAQEANTIWEIINNQFFDMGDAEALETSMKGDIDISPGKLFSILEKKASNFEIHMRVGAIIGGGERKEIDLLGNYGKILGILAGVREDFIDIFEPDELQNRMRNECLPLPILYVLQNPQTKKIIMDILLKPKISNKDAERIVDIVFEDRNVEIFKGRIQNLAKKALKSISGLHNSEAKSLLQTLLLASLEDL